MTSPTNFAPELHTQEAFANQLSYIREQFPEGIVVGSVGRAALTGVELPVLRTRWPAEIRDIDLTTVDGKLPTGVEDTTPFPVDRALAGQITLSNRGDSATVCFDARRPDVSVELPASVFEPREATYRNTRIQTFHPDTMRHLHRINHSGRRKDKRNLEIFEQQLESLNYATIPDHVFEPLDELRELVRKDPHLRSQYMIERLQAWYTSYVPHPVRAVLTPRLVRLKHALGLSGRWG